MRAILFVILLAVTPLISACGTIASVFGVEVVEPETANQRMVVLEASYQACLKTIDAQITAGTINSSNQAKVTEYLDGARKALDAARIALTVDGSDTISLVNSANLALAQLIAFLKTQENS